MTRTMKMKCYYLKFRGTSQLYRVHAFSLKRAQHVFADSENITYDSLTTFSYITQVKNPPLSAAKMAIIIRQPILNN